ncbi:MAG: hypothetical protein ABEJ40_09795 [Haloarculaceae archaeon]
MRANWYCTDCGTRIEREDVDEHEGQGHHVKARLRPERLLSNDPWQVGDEAASGSVSGDAESAEMAADEETVDEETAGDE